ncbi:site-specific integrase [Glycomyces sp. L485]|uniref:tyrosine-type recombinase/integrase n=1 Tax=Glycomyces sp. L485 TaxID=2909235 RepID=UPI001F4AC2EF|nr:site-specific integrase [Glycomyces sp. L485]MCH7231162.1 site-specific integrase [Glycomyces sp. L485]
MARVWVEDRMEHSAYREAVEKAKADGRRPPARWRVRWRDPDGKQRSRSVERKPDADALRTKLENERNLGAYRDPDAGRVRLGDVAETWMAAQVKQKRSTLRLYRIAIDNHIKPRWGDMAVERIRRDDIAAWLGGLECGASQKRQVHGVLSRILDWCVPDRIAVNPAKSVPLPKPPEGRKVYLTVAQVEALTNAAERDVTRVFILVLAYVGLRWGEAAAVKVGNVDITRRRIRIESTLIEGKGGLYEDTPKTGKARTVPLPASVAEEMAPLVKGREADSYVFTTPAGTPLRAGNWRRREFNPALTAAKLDNKGITPHALRHTAASLAIAEGADVKVVQTMLGHADATETLNTYGHLLPDRLDEVSDRMDAARLKVIKPEGLRSDEK